MTAVATRPNPTPSSAPELRLTPLEDIDTVELTRRLPEDSATTAAADFQRGCACPTCETPIAEGSIVTSPPEYRLAPGARWVQYRASLRKAYCPSCRHLIVWTEMVDPISGQLTGHVAAGPALVRSPSKIESFLRAHPHAAGHHEGGRP